MVIVQLSAGLGNQLSSYSVGRAIAHKLNAELKIDFVGQHKEYIKGRHDHFYLPFFNVSAELATPEEIRRVKEKGKHLIRLTGSEKPQDDIYVLQVFLPIQDFADIRDVLLKEFTLKKPLSLNAEAWKQKILSAECAVSLHIRRGDFLAPFHIHIYGMLPLDYYKICVDELKKSFSNLTVFVFSDDLKWAQENLKLDVSTEFVGGCESAEEDLVLMSLCKHNIVANSTFSWWGAWLNANPVKKIFAPDHRGRNYTHEPLIPKTWIKIPVDYEKSVPDSFPPLLSIILYVEKNDSRLALATSGILNQTFRDYELILVDDTSNEDIHHNIEGVKKATLIKEPKKLGKAKACNIALARSRGEYVLFLSEEDILIQKMNSRLGHLYDLFHVQ